MSDVIDQGTGDVLVLLHGAGVDNLLWEPQIAAFAASGRVIAPNLPGHRNVPAVESVEQMADHIHAVLNQRGIDRYAVVGLSLGGMVALEMARHWPDEVTHLAMIEAVPNVSDNRAVLFLARGVISLMRFVGRGLFAVMPARLMGAETADAAHYLKSALARMSAADTYIVQGAALAYDGRPYLPDLQMPALVMVGEKNPSTHKSAKEMAEAIKHCDYQMIPGAGHIANRDAPEIVNCALDELLRR